MSEKSNGIRDHWRCNWSDDVPVFAINQQPDDRDFQNVTDNLAISWSGSDAGSGIYEYEYALGSGPEDDIVGWTNAGLSTTETLEGLSLSENSQYFVSVRATDLAGNLSQTLTGDGILIDLTLPVAGQVIDGIEGDISVDYQFTGSDNTLTGSWSNFEDNASGIAGYEVAVNGGTTVGWSWVGDVSSQTLTGLDLSHGSVYNYSVRATDGSGNVSEVSSSNGIYVLATSFVC